MFASGRLRAVDTCLIRRMRTWRRVELRTQEAERGMNSEEAERLVWAAQEIFANGCELLLFPIPLGLHGVSSCCAIRAMC